MTSFDVSDMNRNMLIRMLWENMPVDAFFSNAGLGYPLPPSKEDIENWIEDGYIDYLNGRYIKIDFKDMKKVDSREYDQIAGHGTFEKNVKQLRELRLYSI
jgi:hypothetical protein